MSFVKVDKYPPMMSMCASRRYSNPYSEFTAVWGEIPQKESSSGDLQV